MALDTGLASLLCVKKCRDLWIFTSLCVALHPGSEPTVAQKISKLGSRSLLFDQIPSGMNDARTLFVCVNRVG